VGGPSRTLPGLLCYFVGAVARSRVTKPFAFSSCRSSRSPIFQLRGRHSCSDPQEEKIPRREQSSKPNSCGAFEAGERRCGLATDGREVAQYHCDEGIQDIADTAYFLGRCSFYNGQRI
jgi:hypothetical protein